MLCRGRMVSSLVDPSVFVTKTYPFALDDGGTNIDVQVPAQLLISCQTAVAGDVGVGEVRGDGGDCSLVLSSILVLPRHGVGCGERDCGGSWLGNSCCGDIYADEVIWCQME